MWEGHSACQGSLQITPLYVEGSLFKMCVENPVNAPPLYLHFVTSFRLKLVSRLSKDDTAYAADTNILEPDF